MSSEPTDTMGGGKTANSDRAPSQPDRPAAGSRESSSGAESAPTGRTVTHKVLSLLTTFESPQRSFTLTQLAESADLPLSTAHRLLNELID